MDLTYETVSNQGERVLEEDRDELLRAHKQRYEFALRYVTPTTRVLDCACGSGYGAFHLAHRAKEVIGMDLSPVALAYCRERYRAPNLTFREGSAEQLPFPDASFDLFCSIETIEHIPHPERLAAEAKRVLRPGGHFLVSTPNRIVSGLKAGEKPSNPFHLFEWSLAEFHACLRLQFPHVRYFGQRMRSRNKFHAKYMVSKLKRLSGMLNLTPLDATPSRLDLMESWASWQPENFVAVCER